MSVSLHNDSMTLTGVSVTRMIACNIHAANNVKNDFVESGSVIKGLRGPQSDCLFVLFSIKSVTYLTHAI